MSAARSLAGPVAAVLVLALADQLVKQVFEATLERRVAVPVFGPLYWFLTENYGIAFSFLDGLGEWPLVALSLVVLGVVIVLWSRTPQGHRFARWGFALVTGGAIGNLIDRAWLGYVTDYVLLSHQGWSFAVFNLADAFITVGAALWLADEMLGWGRRTEAPRGGGGTGSDDAP